MERLETLPCEPQSAAVPEWFALLRHDAQHNARGNAGVAERLGVSRPYVARVLTGNIPVGTVSPRLIAKVIDCYGGWTCPHTGQHLPASACRRTATRTYESLSFAEVDAWRACQDCQHNPLRPAGAAELEATHGCQ